MTFMVPDSTFIVTLTAVSLLIATNILVLRFVDLDAERRMKAEISQYNRELREAMVKKDTAKEEKLKKKDLQMKQMNAKVSMARLKVTFATILPFLGIYYLMASFLGGYGAIVAHSPIPIPYIVLNFGSSGGTIPLFWWYSISSLSFSTILQKLFRTAP